MQITSWNVNGVRATVKKGLIDIINNSGTEPIAVTTDMGVEEHDDEGRVICAEYADFYLINVYVPNSGAGLKRLDYRATWDEAFKNYLADLQKNKPILVTGDFNVAHAAIDLKNDKSNYNKTSGYTQKEIDGLDGILSIGLKDSFRELHPEKVKYSFWSTRFNARASNAGWRIDYFLVSDALMPKVTNAFIDNDTFGSDHCPVGIVLS